MADIVLATFNARYAHASLGLRCLRAALGPLRSRSVILEHTLEDRPADVAERILAERPAIVGLGVYVWNARASAELVSILARVAPRLVLVLGGPEVSYESATLPIAEQADYVVAGEGEVSFARLATALLAGERPPAKVIAGEPPELATVPLPYDEYDATDLAQRNVYVESSRGCPFGCEFCLSSADRHVRRVPLPRFLAAMDGLWARGSRRFRFVDRTFNLGADTSRAVLEHFLAKASEELFLHLEVVPDRLPRELMDTLARFPPGALQLEVGVQTLDDEVAARIGRPQHAETALSVVERLRRDTAAHLHADLVLGLPGEGLDGIARGFDRLYAARPHEIQVGILKRLRGTAIGRHDAEWRMTYADEPPYEILQNRELDFATLQRLKRFARAWDLVGNSGNFLDTAALVAGGGSPFARFLALSDWLFSRTGRGHGIALERLAALLFEYLTTRLGIPQERARAAVAGDWSRPGRRALPDSVFTPAESSPRRAPRPTRRQERHQR